MGLALLLGGFAFLVIIGAPVAFALGIAALAAIAFEGLPLALGFQRIVSGVNVFSLLAIPFFIFAGELMFHGGIAARLVRFAASAVGAVRGGLGIVNVFSSMLFGGISGSAVADVSALGSILIPVMKDKGYDGDYAVNVTVTSSIAGIMIPPSHNMILFAVAAGGGISISQLFVAGVVPGVLDVRLPRRRRLCRRRQTRLRRRTLPRHERTPHPLPDGTPRPVYRRHHRRRRSDRHLHRHRIRRLRHHLRLPRHAPGLSEASPGKPSKPPSPARSAPLPWS